MVLKSFLQVAIDYPEHMSILNPFEKHKNLVKFLNEIQRYYFYLISLMSQINNQVKEVRSDFWNKPLANYISIYNSSHRVICLCLLAWTKVFAYEFHSKFL